MDQALVHGQGVDERLERRSRRAPGRGPVDLAENGVVEKVCRPHHGFQRHSAPVQHQYRRIVDAFGRMPGDMGANQGFNGLLPVQIQGRMDDPAFCRQGFGIEMVHEMGRLERQPGRMADRQGQFEKTAQGAAPGVGA